MKAQKQKTVFVGLSGGVDSSVAAARLVREGYRVVGVFIQVWHPEFLECNWEKERLDAMRVCATVGIPFLTCDATERYKAEVADYLIAEYKAGRTPNPDVMCNKHIKFGAFLDFADEHGADCIATGHYARRRVRKRGALPQDVVETFDQREKVSYNLNSTGTVAPAALFRGADPAKDQSYFLWTLTQAQLALTLFPIGDSLKSDIRKEAAGYGLPTAEKPDSQGVCFLGELNMKEFLSHFIPSERGRVEDTTGKTVGEHDGVYFYTLGQRHGFRVHQTTSGEKPYYIVEKNLADNTLVVSHQKPSLDGNSGRSFSLTGTNWLAPLPPHPTEVQVRYRQKPVPAALSITGPTSATVTPLEAPDTPAIGQSCVIYDREMVLGGGIVDRLG